MQSDNSKYKFVSIVMEIISGNLLDFFFHVQGGITLPEIIRPEPNSNSHDTSVPVYQISLENVHVWQRYWVETVCNKTEWWKNGKG